MTLTCLIVLIRIPWLKIANAMNSINFVQYFPDEESCEVYLKGYREKMRIRCKTCKSITKHYWFSTSAVVSAKSIPLENPETGKTSRFCGYNKMEVLGKVDGEHAEKFIKKHEWRDRIVYRQKHSI